MLCCSSFGTSQLSVSEIYNHVHSYRAVAWRPKAGDHVPRDYQWCQWCLWCRKLNFLTAGSGYVMAHLRSFNAWGRKVYYSGLATLDCVYYRRSTNRSSSWEEAKSGCGNPPSLSKSVVAKSDDANWSGIASYS